MWRTLIVLCLFAWPNSGCISLPTQSVAATTSRASFNVRDFGATGDGKTLDTPGINAAIIAAHAAGGGTVYLPAGKYLCYSIRLQSNVAIYLEQGCTIVAADTTSAAGYDPPEPNPWNMYQDFGHCHWHNSLIWGDGIENVSILGPGLIHGVGLSKGDLGRVDPTNGPASRPATSRVASQATSQPTSRSNRNQHDPRDTLVPTPNERPWFYTPQTPYPHDRDTLRAGYGNKSIALKNCHNVTLRDFSMLHGGHFAILATGVDNLAIDNLKIDTNRDGMDIDCCQNVRVTNCTVNSPGDDGICLKSSFGLGYARSTENVTISDCYVTGGYREGSVLSAKYERIPSDIGTPRTGRIKFGTESNGGFKRITITNCVFDNCGGLAIESVDGATIEDVTISNIVMRDIVNAPIFIRLGNRARGPDYPKPGFIRRVNISNVIVSNANWRYGSIISGIPGFPIEDLSISDVHIQQQGGGTETEAAGQPVEMEESYPEPNMFGTMPSSGFFLRHVKNFSMHHSEIRNALDDARPLMVLDDVAGADFDHVKGTKPKSPSFFRLQGVTNFVVHNSFDIADIRSPSPEDGGERGTLNQQQK